MLTLVADTHGREAHCLDGRTLAAVRAADHVVHAGDFTTEQVLDAFSSETDTLTAVYGNNDSAAVRDRLTDVATPTWQGLQLVVVHGHDHSETALGMLARQEDADLVVVGHSHRPQVGELDGRLLVNPGSHAQPRQYRPAHAEVERTDAGIGVRLRSPDGTTFSTIHRER